MSVKPILFNTEMVRAILDGRKIVTRRIIKPKYKGELYPIWEYPDKLIFEKTNSEWWQIWINQVGSPYTCTKPPYKIDDVLYVRETWRYYKNGYMYKADTKEDWDGMWHPSIHMPKEAARIFLKVTDIKVDRLQNMTDDDALKEGCEGFPCNHEFAYMAGGSLVCTDCMNTAWLEPPLLDFMYLWDSTIQKKDLYKYGWDANPWVWVIEFERCDKPNLRINNDDI